MAMYLGTTKVSPSITNTVLRTITKDSGGNIVSDVTTQPITVYDDPDNLSTDLPVITEWTRPSEWPNLDALPVLTEGIYLTYDNRSAVDCKWAAFRCWTNTGNWVIAQGHINGTSFVQDATWTQASNTVKEINYSSSSYNFVIFKITPASTNHIQQFYFSQIAQATLGTFALRPQYDQHCIERLGWLPYLTTTAGSADAYRYCTEWMECDKVKFGDTLTSLVAAWFRARKLKKIDFLGWTGENCNITNLQSAFDSCVEIEELDLSLWKTTNWHIASIAYMFSTCLRLKKLNVTWDTANWGNGSSRTMSLQYTFNNCRSLEQLDLSSWDTSGWNNTTLQLTWQGCWHLKSLNVSNWNTSNWKNTTLQQTWNGCNALVNVDLSNWNTTQWTVNRTDYCFTANYRRRSFEDIKYWVTTNWRPTTMYAMFDSCYTAQEIDLSRWDVSEWPVTDLGACWSNCRSMRSLKVGTWDMTKTDKWKVTSIYAIFNNCYNLEDSTFYNWHPTNWTITRAGSAFYACYKLPEIDFTKWIGPTWNLADGTSHGNCIAGYCYSAKKVDLSPLNFTNIALNNYGSNGTSYTNVMECYQAETINLPATFKGKLNLRYNYNLSRTEIVKIFNALPTALSGATIIITEMRYKLTTADIAIATNKGYTVS